MFGKKNKYPWNKGGEGANGVYAGPEFLQNQRVTECVYAGPDYFLGKKGPGAFAPANTPEENLPVDDPADIPANALFCAQCGKANPAGARFCSECGTPFEAEGE